VAKSGDTKKSSKLQASSATRSADARVSANTLAASILDELNHDCAAAAAELERRVLADDALFQEVMMPLVRQACVSFMSVVVRSRRASSCASVTSQADSAIAGTSALVARASSLLDFPLYGGKLLRNATAAECTDSARQYEKQAADMAGKGRFLRSVAKQAGDRVVGQALTEIELVRLFKQAMQS